MSDTHKVINCGNIIIDTGNEEANVMLQEALEVLRDDPQTRALIEQMADLMVGHTAGSTMAATIQVLQLQIDHMRRCVYGLKPTQASPSSTRH